MPSQLFDVPALLVEARFRERPIASRLLLARGARAFVVGPGRGADAPIDSLYLPASAPANDNHVLVEARGDGFVVNLSPAMWAGLACSPTHLRVPCGEVVFDLSAATPPPRVPRPWIERHWRADAPLVGGVGVALLLLLAVVRSVPLDPHALSLGDVGRSVRLDLPRAVSLAPPPTTRARAGVGGAAAAGRSGVAGSPKARTIDGRRATKGPASRSTARDAAAAVTDDTMLRGLDGSRTFAQLRDDGPALGPDAADVLAHLSGRQLAETTGGGLGPSGTGAYGGDTGRPLLGVPGGLATVGRAGGPDDGSRSYGRRAGELRQAVPRALDVTLIPATVRGGLDREIVRRVVRQHLNEIRYCYEQSLARRPTLAGRLVAALTIAPTGRVVVATLQSSTLGEPAAESCIVAATRRWEFPRPAGGGLVAVSYPFQLAPAGG
jgi:hypothetical protein